MVLPWERVLCRSIVGGGAASSAETEEGAHSFTVDFGRLNALIEALKLFGRKVVSLMCRDYVLTLAAPGQVPFPHDVHFTALDYSQTLLATMVHSDAVPEADHSLNTVQKKGAAVSQASGGKIP